MNMDTEDARQEYLARQARLAHPKGEFDNGGRWYPDAEERQACCDAIRTPSRRWPYSLMVHCRTAVHVANLYNVDRKEVVKL